MPATISLNGTPEVDKSRADQGEFPRRDMRLGPSGGVASYDFVPDTPGYCKDGWKSAVAEGRCGMNEGFFERPHGTSPSYLRTDVICTQSGVGFETNALKHVHAVAGSYSAPTGLGQTW